MKLQDLFEQPQDGANLRKKLERTRLSLINHIARGNRLNNTRSYQLIDKYSELKDEAWGSVWEQFCDDHAYSKHHDAYDYFA